MVTINDQLVSRNSLPESGSVEDISRPACNRLKYLKIKGGVNLLDVPSSCPGLTLLILDMRTFQGVQDSEPLGAALNQVEFPLLRILELNLLFHAKTSEITIELDITSHEPLSATRENPDEETDLESDYVDEDFKKLYRIGSFPRLKDLQIRPCFNEITIELTPSLELLKAIQPMFNSTVSCANPLLALKLLNLSPLTKHQYRVIMDDSDLVLHSLMRFSPEVNLSDIRQFSHFKHEESGEYLFYSREILKGDVT
ncbi:hypothetical protein WICPIJ_007566 [Wickerhamomyces pijperi]|uniref:Uncharacterized protein n=1 Tax=Wickerhamomyces pijperi TaxID=599730 RepID=A0A9P8Q0A1_WICPI|nr:hypothetical protein WICPIJ_007566 [Wickerhamomyces pijperi]